MHSYKALLINCMDPRLQDKNEIKIAAAAGLAPGQYEVLTYAGPSLWMTDPHQSSHTETFWWEFEQISLNVHHITSVVIIGHSSCGGFVLKGAPQDPDKEKELIISSLKSSADIIKQKHPDLETKLVFVEIGPESDEGLPRIFPEII